MIAATFINSLTAILAKAIYMLHPHEISPIQLMAIESVGCSLLNALIIGRDWKSILWDSISKEQWPYLIGRTTCGVFSGVIMFVTVQFYPVSLVAAVNNCAPVVAFVGGLIFLRESYSKNTTVALVLTFLGATLLVVGGGKSSMVPKDANFWIFLLMLSNPFCLAGTTLLYRKIRALHYQTPTCYRQFLAVPILFGVLLYRDQSVIPLLQKLGLQSWLLLVGMCISQVYQSVLQFSAMKCHEASALQPYEFLRPVYSFFADLLIFGSKFTSWQVIGVGTVFLAFVIQILNHYCSAEQVKSDEKKLLKETEMRSDTVLPEK